MTAKIIAVCNQKGGSGKTTISMHLAGGFARRGKTVLIVDTDVQATATRWAASAGDETPFPAAVTGLSAARDKVHREVRKFIANFELIVIDCPPAAESLIPRSALWVADLAIVPIIPSPPDLWAAVGIKKVIEEAASFNEGLEARLLMNQVQRTNIAKEALTLISEFEIPPLETHVRHRTAYREAAGIGGTVFDLGREGQPASHEIEGIMDEITTILGEI